MTRQDRCARRRPGRIGLAAALVSLALLGDARAWAQGRPIPQRESFRLDAPLLVAKQFENIRGLIEEEDWTSAFAALEQVTDEHSEALVTVEEGHYLNAVDFARLLTLRLPAEGLAAWREQIDGWARQQYEEAVRHHDEQGLELLLRDAYASRWGDNALWTLGEWLWERGEIEAARAHWQQLIAPPGGDAALLPVYRFPDPEFREADVRARLALCSLMERDFVRFAREHQAFAHDYAGVEGTIAGQSGVLSDLLGRLSVQAAHWPAESEGLGWPTFARNHRRNGAVPTPVSLDGPRWLVPLAALQVSRWERNRPAMADTGPLGRYPVAVDGGLFFHDGETIRALRLADGHPRWPLGEATDIGNIYPPFHVLPNMPFLRPTVGVPRFTLTVEDGRLYALTGPSVLTMPEAGLRAAPTRLVCLDIATGQGLLQWFRIAEDLFPDGWMMTGTPLALRDRLYLPLLRTEPQLEQAVACLSAEGASVSVNWLQAIGQALRDPLAGRVELGHQLLTVVGDRVVCSTDLGAVAALDAESGVIRWAVTYPSTPLPDLTRSEEAAAGLLPPLANDGRVFVKPNDSPELMALDAATGALLWRRALPSRIVHLLGVQGADLYVSGDHLWSLEAATGEVHWRFGFDDPAGYGYGRGAIAGRRVFWTTHDDLFVIDRLSGTAVQRYPLRELIGVSGGHIILAEDRLVIAGPDHLTAFALSPVDN